MNSALRKWSPEEITTIAATNGKTNILNAEIFAKELNDPRGYPGLDVIEGPTRPITVQTYKLIDDAKFETLLTENQKSCLTQNQVVEFCQNNQSHFLKHPSWATFFICKNCIIQINKEKKGLRPVFYPKRHIRTLTAGNRYRVIMAVA